VSHIIGIFCTAHVSIFYFDWGYIIFEIIKVTFALFTRSINFKIIVNYSTRSSFQIILHSLYNHIDLFLCLFCCWCECFIVMAFGLFSQTYMILVIINRDSHPQYIWGEGRGRVIQAPPENSRLKMGFEPTISTNATGDFLNLLLERQI